MTRTSGASGAHKLVTCVTHMMQLFIITLIILQPSLALLLHKEDENGEVSTKVASKNCVIQCVSIRDVLLTSQK